MKSRHQIHKCKSIILSAVDSNNVSMYSAIAIRRVLDGQAVEEVGLAMVEMVLVLEQVPALAPVLAVMVASESFAMEFPIRSRRM